MAERRRFGVLRIFAATSLGRQLTVFGCLLAASLAEGFGLASLLPLLAVAAGQAGNDSVVGRIVLNALDAVGLPADIGVLLVVVVGGLALKAGLTLFAMRHVGYAVAEVATGLRLSLIRTLLEVRWGYFARQPVGRFANAISSEASRAGDAYLAVANLITVAFQAAIYLSVAFLVSWQLSLTALAVGSVIVASLNKLVRMTRKAGRQQTRRTKLLVARLSDALVGIKPLKAMARHVRLGKLFAADAQDLNDSLRRQVISRQATRSLQEPMLAIFLGIGFYAAMRYWAVPVVEFIVMGLLMARTVALIGRIQLAYQTVHQSESAYWAIRDTIAEARAEREVVTGTRAPTLTTACVFDRVWFAFGSKTVLEDISLTVAAGKVTTITGASGVGKTTIADLLLGLYRPDRGEIRIDGAPLPEIDLLRWRGMVGYVPQEVILFHDTILANVTLGEDGIGAEDARAALEAAGAWDFVAQLPDGMDSIVGERGTLLSGGQRQRIAVARALVHRPSLLILDEATSALDPETEAAICRNVVALMARSGLTILAISHQRAWIEAADRVYRLHRHHVEELSGPMPAILAS